MCPIPHTHTHTHLHGHVVDAAEGPGDSVGALVLLLFSRNDTRTVFGGLCMHTNVSCVRQVWAGRRPYKELRIPGRVDIRDRRKRNKQHRMVLYSTYLAAGLGLHAAHEAAVPGVHLLGLLLSLEGRGWAKKTLACGGREGWMEATCSPIPPLGLCPDDQRTQGDLLAHSV